jgi:hypothetical protein
MSQRTLKWWHWFLIGLLCLIFAMVTGPIADRHGYGTFPSFIVSILADVAWAVCWVIAVIRFWKWVWSLRKPIRNAAGRPGSGVAGPP